MRLLLQRRQALQPRAKRGHASTIVSIFSLRITSLIKMTKECLVL